MLLLVYGCCRVHDVVGYMVLWVREYMDEGSNESSKQTLCLCLFSHSFENAIVCVCVCVWVWLCVLLC